MTAEITVEKIEEVLNGAKARLDAAKTLKRELSPGGRFYGLTQYVEHSEHLSAEESTTFWRSRERIIDDIESLPAPRSPLIHNPNTMIDLDWQIQAYQIQIRHLEAELDRVDRGRIVKADFEALTEAIDKKIGEFVNAHLLDEGGAVDYKNEKERVMLDKLTNVQEILGLL